MISSKININEIISENDKIDKERYSEKIQMKKLLKLYSEIDTRTET